MINSLSFKYFLYILYWYIFSNIDTKAVYGSTLDIHRNQYESWSMQLRQQLLSVWLTALGFVHSQQAFRWPLDLPRCLNNKWYIDNSIFHSVKMNNKSLLLRPKIFIPWAPNIVAFTVDNIFNWVAIVGILSQTWSKLCNQITHDKYILIIYLNDT